MKNVKWRWSVRNGKRRWSMGNALEKLKV